MLFFFLARICNDAYTTSILINFFYLFSFKKLCHLISCCVRSDFTPVRCENLVRFNPSCRFFQFDCLRAHLSKCSLLRVFIQGLQCQRDVGLGEADGGENGRQLRRGISPEIVEFYAKKQIKTGMS